MNVILNEVKSAELMYRNGDIGKRPTATLYLIGRYLRQKKGMKPREVVSALNAFMAIYSPGYNPDIWESRIERIAKTSNKYPLREIDFIGITQNELDTINCISDYKQRRLTFVMLCYAKYYNTVSKNNNGWVNAEITDIFTAARVSTHYKDDKFKIFYKLRQAKSADGTPLFSLSKKNTNTNVKLNFVDMDGEPVLKIYDYRELGYEYLNYYDPDAFIRCEVCGILVRKNLRKPKYCRTCAKKVDREKAKKRMSKLRA